MDKGRRRRIFSVGDNCVNCIKVGGDVDVDETDVKGVGIDL